MIHPGQVVREAEFRKRELERQLAHRQAGVRCLASVSGQEPGLRDAYYRQLGRIGQRICAQGLELGCALESHALARRSGAVQQSS